MSSVKEAKLALDKIINKSRVHLYKPIQIAEILYHHRTVGGFDLLELESYRNTSKKWRDEVSIELLGRVCTSSARFQDDLFNENAVPPRLIKLLGEENENKNGIVEAYIYKLFDNKHSQLSDALDILRKSNPSNFSLKCFIDSFWNEPGLKRSIDKIYEIIVYSLFSALIELMDLKVTVSFSEEKFDLVKEFNEFTSKVLCLDFDNPVHVENAKVYRVGVTNAADRGLDMYSNWGPAIQIKHLSLDEGLAEEIVNSVSSDKIVIVCKTAEKKIILSLLNQIGWKTKIQSIITEDDLIDWYEKALRGKYSSLLGQKLLDILQEQVEEEFPSVEQKETIIDRRKYFGKYNDALWGKF
ncbi:MAG: HaeII family restriction endonuclease [Bacilli bacterium]|nr:HaeII family restriction endonuclease [Bacilli bacterium]